MYVEEILIRSAEVARSHQFFLHVGVARLDDSRLLLRFLHVHLSSLGDGRKTGHSSLLNVGCDSSGVGRVNEDILRLLGHGSVDLDVLLSHFVANEVAVVPLVTGKLHLVFQEVFDLVLRHASLEDFVNPALLFVLQRLLERFGDSHSCC